MKTILYGIIYAFILLGIIGAYGLTLGMMNMVTNKVSRFAYLGFIFPGIAYVIGYSFLGFFVIFQPWTFFSEDSPVLWIIEEWKENTIGSAIGSIIFIGTWTLIYYFYIYVK